MSLSAPRPITADCRVDLFDCGEPSLNDWLRRRALANQATGATRTFVVCEEDRVVGFHALATGAILLGATTGRFRRNMPDPVPVVVLARLAVDRGLSGRGLGRALVRDAGRRVLHAAEAVGVRGIVVHALNPRARDFYLALGFAASPLDDTTLMITLADLAEILA